MTRKLYLENPYLKECDATITKTTQDTITLDQTILFAFSGGQESDSGTIEGKDIIDATIQDQDITYLIPDHALKTDDRVHLILNWEKRYKIMRLHTAAHIAYYTATNAIGKQQIIGSNITHEKARIDFQHTQSIAPLIPQIQQAFNQTIQQNTETQHYPDPANPEKWWWQLNDWKMPCGGTHVRKTSEIGKATLKRKNTGAGKERIEITLEG